MRDFQKEKQEIVQQKSDAFMKQVACLIAEENLQEYRISAESKEGTELPAELRRTLEETVQREETREKREARTARRKRSIRSLAQVAVILLACFLVGGVALTVTVDAFRIKLMEILLQDQGEYVDVDVVEAGSLPPDVLGMIPEEWNSLYYPGWLPEGYGLVTVDGKENFKDFTFESKQDGYLSFSYDSFEETNMMVDSEDSEIERIKIGRSEGACIEKDGRTILIWSQDGFTYQLVMSGSRENAVKIAENIVYISLSKK